MAAILITLFAKKNTAFLFDVALPSQANPEIFQDTPTLAGGDVTISGDGGIFLNLANLPIANGKSVNVNLTASEMNANRIVIVFNDVAGAQWSDVIVLIQTYDRLFNELLYPTYQVPDSVSSDGARPTIEQAIYMLTQVFSDRAVVGSTVTVFKPDGVTALMTFTLNSPTNPTAITRSA